MQIPFPLPRGFRRILPLKEVLPFTSDFAMVEYFFNFVLDFPVYMNLRGAGAGESRVC